MSDNYFVGLLALIVDWNYVFIEGTHLVLVSEKFILLNENLKSIWNQSLNFYYPKV